MPEPIPREQAIAAFLRMGYEVTSEGGDMIVFTDRNYPARPMAFNFNWGGIDWDDFRRELEYEGVNVAVFLAELESM